MVVHAPKERKIDDTENESPYPSTVGGLIKKKIMDRIRSELLQILLILFVVCLFFWNVILNPDKMIYSTHSDIVRQFYPWHLVSNGLAGRGIVPFWNPYCFSGEPLLANMQLGYFYPVNIIMFRLLPVHAVYGYSIMLHLTFAGVSLYLLARHLGLDRTCSMVSGMLFIFSGFFMGHIYSGHYSMICAAAWMPLLFLLLDVSLQRKSVIWAMLFGLAIAVQFLAGHIQMSLFTLMVSGVYFVYHIFEANLEKKDIKRSVKLTLIMTIALFIAAAISLIQFLPTYEYTSLTTRSGGVSYGFATDYSMYPWNLLTIVLPDLFGNPVDGTYWNLGNYWELSFYMGIPTLILVAFAIPLRKNRHVRFFAVLGLAALVLSLGKYSGIYWVIWRFVPGFDILRVPARFIFITVFSASLLSGFGLSYLRGRLTGALKRKIYDMTRVFLIASIVLLSLGFTILFIGRVERFIVLDIFALSVLVAFTAALLYWRIRNKDNVRSFSVCIIVLLLLNLGFYHMELIDVKGTDQIYRPSGYIEFLQQDHGDFRVYDASDVIEDNFQMVYGIETVDGYNPLRLEQYTELKDNIGGLSNVQRHPVLDILNVKYVLVDHPLNNSGLDMVFHDAKLTKGGHSVYVYLNPWALGRAFIVHNLTKASGAEMFQRMRSYGFDPGSVAFVDDVDYVPVSDIEGSANETVVVTERNADALRLDVEMASAGCLVVSQTYYPTWKVYVDGYPGELLRVDGALQGVRLKAGPHEVHFVCDEYFDSLPLAG